MHVLLPALAALLILAAPSALAAASSKPPPEALRALDLSNALSFKVGALERQFQQIRLATAFTAASLISAQGVAEGRATLARLRDLTAQRAALVDAHFAALDKMRTGGTGLAGMDSFLEKGRLAHQQLHAARLDLAAEAETLLVWAEDERAQMRLENGRIRFSSPALQSRFNELFARLDGALRRHEIAVDEFEAFRKANHGRFIERPIPTQGKPVR